MEIGMNAKQFRPFHVSVDDATLDGDHVLRVVKNDKLMDFDTNSYAHLLAEDFHNGTISVKVRSRILPDAPEFARGFIGIVFRAQENGSEFESYYVRPTNGRNCRDAARRAHGSQYFAFPGYSVYYFREFGIEGVEAPCDIDLDEWITVKAVIHGDRGEFYVNDLERPALVVEHMKHGDSRGGVGLFVDIGTEGFFKDLEICRA